MTNDNSQIVNNTNSDKKPLTANINEIPSNSYFDFVCEVKYVKAQHEISEFNVNKDDVGLINCYCEVGQASFKLICPHTAPTICSIIPIT